MNNTPFLAQVAEYILNFHNKDTRQLVVVLPSRRGRLFLGKHLSNKIDKPLLSPLIFSIEDFIYEIAGLQKIDNYELLFEFYKVYQSTETKEQQPFEEFVSWASILMNDFNELDAYHVDTNSFFNYLNEERALTQWSPDRSELTEFQKQYLKFWKSLPNYYLHLKNYCLNEKKAYPGLAYRIATEKVISNQSGFEDRKILFAGFNALSGCEEQIINVLAKRNKAELLFDADDYYVNHKYKEAGRSLRKHIKNPYFKNPNLFNFSWINENFKEEKNITLIPCNYNLAQPKIVAEILNKNFNQEGGENWSLVLADESLLLPILNALPENVKKANISMGYPFKNSPLFEFLISYLSVINSARNFNDGKKLTAKHLLTLLSKPQIFHFASRQTIYKIEQTIIKGNSLFVSGRDIKDFDSDTENLIRILFNPHENIIEQIIALCCKIKSESLFNPIEYSFSSETILFLEKLKQSQQKSGISLNAKQFTLLLKQLSSQISIPFIGEPLNGLQINGLLETRTLDFENLIITSLNEGFLPTGKKLNSFVPFDVKREFGLPTFNDKDAIFAYHFYRLISRAKNVFLLYVENEDSERSRFIDQLLFEIPEYNSFIEIKTQSYNPPLPQNFNSTNEKEILKEPWIIDLIKAKLSKGVSPSTLINYLNCNLRFFYSDIIKIKEDEELDEELDAANFGNILHEALENIFKPAINISLTEVLTNQLFENKEKHLIESFENNFGKKNLIEGKNAILFKIMMRLLANYQKTLTKELTTQPFTIKHLEKELLYETDIEGLPVVLKGKADRIDLVSGTYRIIDYKSGKVTSGDLSINTLDDLEQKNKAFQVLFYAYLLHKTKELSTPIQSGIISFRNLSAGLLNFNYNKNNFITQDLLQQFEYYLNSLIIKILDPSISFKKTENVKQCEYCTYREICNRNV